MTEQLELNGIIDYRKEDWNLKVERDEFCDIDPREWDTVGMFCVSNRCKYLKDESGLADDLDWYNSEQDQEKLESMGYSVWPVSVYDHSGVSIYIGGSCDAWDSGQIGWYIVNKDSIRKHFGIKRVTAKVMECVEKIVRNEVKTYNAYYNGDVYNFTLSRNGEEVESCGGFFDDYDEPLEFVKDIYSYLPSEFRQAFTLEETKEMVGNSL